MDELRLGENFDYRLDKEIGSGGHRCVRLSGNRDDMAVWNPLVECRSGGWKQWWTLTSSEKRRLKGEILESRGSNCYTLSARSSCVMVCAVPSPTGTSPLIEGHQLLHPNN